MMAEDLVEIRRDLHRHPELSFQETRTARIVCQEMEALGKENQAKVILAEAEIPRAIAGAFNSGNL